MRVQASVFSFVAAALWLSVVGQSHAGEIFDARISVGGAFTLNQVFDSGLRPRRVSAQLRDECHTGPVRLELAILGGQPFKFDAADARFVVLANNRIARCELATEAVADSELLETINPIIAQLGMPSSGLSEALRRPDELPDGTQRWFGSKDLGELTASLTVQRVFGDEDQAKAKADLVMEWKIPPGGLRFLTVPVTAPPGYESESMEPLPFTPVGPPMEEYRQSKPTGELSNSAKQAINERLQGLGVKLIEPSAGHPPPFPKPPGAEKATVEASGMPGDSPWRRAWWVAFGLATASLLMLGKRLRAQKR